MSLLSLCRKTCDIQRPTTTAGTVGGVQRAFSTTAYNDIACTIQPKRGSLRGEHGKLSQNITHVIYTPTTIALQVGDRAVVDSVNYIIHAWGDQADRGEVFAMYVERKD